MSFSRREFLKHGGISAIGMGILFSNPQKLIGQSLFDKSIVGENLLYSLTPETFKKYIGNEFTFYTEEAAYQGTLSEVIVPTAKKQIVSVRRKSKTSTTFFLKFNVQTPNLPQATYKVYEKSLGQFDLLLVPGNPFDDKSVLIATFNRV
ncbi:MAG: hypothetical protein ABJA66_00240 [Actinomycetota bacterium]